MEQQTGPKSPPVHGAATDPAFVPGLMSVVPATRGGGGQEPLDDKAAEEVDDQVLDEAPEEPGAVESEPEKSPPVQDDKTPDVDAPDNDASEEAAADKDATDDEARDGAIDDSGAEFEASDRRGTIAANRDGLVLRLDDQEAEFDWSEIGAVEYGTTAFPRRLTVTVHLRNRHRYESDVTAGSKDRLTEWTEQLDAVLDAYFEE
ncbi:hypothetical protein [Streptomyces sp. NBC_00344]|uniref:hypothetical protein n=1 Tax=Streptomyces sp. NBC_00344 TaxID=2975720 RepID=UPI002E1FB31C